MEVTNAASGLVRNTEEERDRYRWGDNPKMGKKNKYGVKS
jgi:hypothetical protein